MRRIPGRAGAGVASARRPSLGGPRGRETASPWLGRLPRTALPVLVVAALASWACRSMGPPRPEESWERGVAVLERPLQGDLAALYRLRSGGSGWLRLSVLTRGEAGRMTVSGSFGAALSLVAWDGRGKAMVADLKKGCRLPVEDASAVLGLDRLPLPQAVRLLAGRLPRSRHSRPAALGGGVYRIEGAGWSCRAVLAADPWRVVRVEGPAGPDGPRWRVGLARHMGSLPGRLDIETPSGRRVVLELVRLEWSTTSALPDLPELPACTAKK